MRISAKVLLVGGIPILVAAIIAFVAYLLLDEAERARNGAVRAGAAYRNLIVAMTARDDYVEAGASERWRHGELFEAMASQARIDLTALSLIVRSADHRAATAGALDALSRYVERMKEFRAVTIQNDELARDMAVRAASLLSLTDQARERQHASNADIVATLTTADRRLRVTRDIVDQAQELRAAIAAGDLRRARLEALPPAPNAEAAAAAADFTLDRVRLANAVAALAATLRADGRDDEAAELQRLAASPQLPAGRLSPDQSLAAWADRLVKINATEHRALLDQTADLRTYAVEANETEQATQTIAIETLKMSQRSDAALGRRDADATDAVLESSRDIGATVAAMPISPLIQSEMIDALDRWRDGLAATAEGLRQQNGMIADMDGSAVTMIAGARSLNDMLARNADQIGGAIRKILVIGAAIGLFLGAATGLVVARSIARPLNRLQTRMKELAVNPEAGPIAGADRRDELGDMARATHHFVTEIARREQALRGAKERADEALAELQKTQTELIQAEKLASLGQLVAGVAHEINTPLGIALTTSTLIGDEVRRFEAAAGNRQLQRSVLARFVQRMEEGSGLLFANLTRAADLVQSFKQVAADQASGERRRFEMDAWLRDLLTSLGPVLKKRGHQVDVACRAGLVMDSYPGALAQVITNLLMNAVTHAYAEGDSGRIFVSVEEPDPDTIRILFADDGRGVPPENLARVFDPFFTTGRSAGSTGLGLHIVYNLVTGLLQGRIEIASKPGRGTRFTIDLPTRLADAEPDERARELEAFPG